MESPFPPNAICDLSSDFHSHCFRNCFIHAASWYIDPVKIATSRKLPFLEKQITDLCLLRLPRWAYFGSRSCPLGGDTFIFTARYWVPPAAL
jgi:hypothetical protein